MRDPARIHELLEQIRKTWQLQPDMRLGQLLVNVIRPSQPCPEVFHVEDDQLAAKLDDYRSTLANSVQKLRYFKSRSRYLEINYQDWGKALLLFELDHANFIVRQVHDYETGPVLGYDREIEFDEFGLRLRTKLEDVAEDYVAIPFDEFQIAWQKCNNR